MRVATWISVLFLVGASALTPAVAVAGPQVLSWDQIVAATTYGVEQSLDNGATWTAVTPTTGPTCVASRCSATVSAPATGLTLYRIWAANAVGRTTRFTAGLWICESCAPPPPAANMGVQ